MTYPKEWFIHRLFIIPAVISTVLFLIIIPLIGALRNYILYHYFTIELLFMDLPYLILYAWIPGFIILIPLTALGLFLYLKITRKRKNSVDR